MKQPIKIHISKSNANSKQNLKKTNATNIHLGFNIIHRINKIVYLIYSKLPRQYFNIINQFVNILSTSVEDNFISRFPNDQNCSMPNYPPPLSQLLVPQLPIPTFKMNKQILGSNNTKFKPTRYLIPHLKYHLTMQEKMVYRFRLIATKKHNLDLPSKAHNFYLLSCLSLEYGYEAISRKNNYFRRCWTLPN